MQAMTNALFAEKAAEVAVAAAMCSGLDIRSSDPSETDPA
jgi:hypothetical protein